MEDNKNWKSVCGTALKHKENHEIIDEMAREMERLHDALAFWLPEVPVTPGPMQERIVRDAYLLVGYDDIPDENTAEELGWIVAVTPGIPLPEKERYERIGKFVVDVAKQFGWDDDGEGAFEFMQRHAYETGHTDKKVKIT